VSAANELLALVAGHMGLRGQPEADILPRIIQTNTCFRPPAETGIS